MDKIINNKTYPVEEVCIENSEALYLIPEFICKLKIKPKIYFEIGSNIGSTSKKVRNILPKDSQVYLFDFEENKKHIQTILDSNTFFFGSDSSKIYDSYNWNLMSLLIQGVEPDFVFIDGKHTFDTDWLCFFLIDKMIKDNGYIYFDDYNWSISISKSMAPKKFPKILNQYTENQINTKHIKILVDNLLDQTYVNIIPNKLYQKCKIK